MLPEIFQERFIGGGDRDKRGKWEEEEIRGSE
jgi:hypothetical protein